MLCVCARVVWCVDFGRVLRKGGVRRYLRLSTRLLYSIAVTTVRAKTERHRAWQRKEVRKEGVGRRGRAREASISWKMHPAHCLLLSNTKGLAPQTKTKQEKGEKRTPDLGKALHGDAEVSAHVLIPLARVNVHEERAAGVGDIRLFRRGGGGGGST